MSILNQFIILVFMLISFQLQASEVLLKSGVKAYRQGDYTSAAVVFQNLSEADKISEETRAQAHYYLGLSLYKLQLFQASSYPILKAIKSTSKKYRQKALLKLVAIANKLNNQRMLDIAMADLQGADLNLIPQDIYYYQQASVQYDKNNIDKAIQLLKEALLKNSKSEPALNLLAIAYLRKNEIENAVATYQKLLGLYANENQNDQQKAYTQLNLARAYFQAKQFDKAIEQYQLISNQTPAYRESLTEQAWSYLHSTKYQKAIGVLQNLHTPFYENYFDPESLFLRTILLNYTCQFDEAEAAIKSFNTNYSYISEIITNWVAQPAEFKRAYLEIEYTQEVLRNEKRDQKYAAGLVRDYNGKIPFKATRSAMKDNRLSSVLDSYQALQAEEVQAYKLFNGDRIALKPYLEQIYKSRTDYYENQVAQLFHKILNSLKTNIDYFKEQLTFVGYEIIDTKKIQLRQKTLPSGSIKLADNTAIRDEKKLSRGQYEKAGRRYWPFSGEIWKDEVGAYQYFGDNNCVQE